MKLGNLEETLITHDEYRERPITGTLEREWEKARDEKVILMKTFHKNQCIFQFSKVRQESNFWEFMREIRAKIKFKPSSSIFT